MIKYYCDACGKEIKGLSYDIRIMKHITNNYSDVDNTQMLCLLCYNEVMYKLWENLEKIRKNNNIIQ